MCCLAACPLDGGGDVREVRGGVAGQDSECCGRNEQSGGSGDGALLWSDQVPVVGFVPGQSGVVYPDKDP